jgi:hypothetical protein
MTPNELRHSDQIDQGQRQLWHTGLFVFSSGEVIRSPRGGFAGTAPFPSPRRTRPTSPWCSSPGAFLCGPVAARAGNGGGRVRQVLHRLSCLGDLAAGLDQRVPGKQKAPLSVKAKGPFRKRWPKRKNRDRQGPSPRTPIACPNPCSTARRGHAGCRSKSPVHLSGVSKLVGRRMTSKGNKDDLSTYSIILMDDLQIKTLSVRATV